MHWLYRWGQGVYQNHLVFCARMPFQQYSLPRVVAYRIVIDLPEPVAQEVRKIVKSFDDFSASDCKIGRLIEIYYCAARIEIRQQPSCLIGGDINRL